MRNIYKYILCPIEILILTLSLEADSKLSRISPLYNIPKHDKTTVNGYIIVFDIRDFN